MRREYRDIQNPEDVSVSNIWMGLYVKLSLENTCQEEIKLMSER